MSGVLNIGFKALCIALGFSYALATPPFALAGTTSANQAMQTLSAVGTPPVYYPPTLPNTAFSEPIRSIATLSPEFVSHGPMIVYLEASSSATGIEPMFVPYILKSDGSNGFKLTVRFW